MLCVVLTGLESKPGCALPSPSRDTLVLQLPIQVSGNLANFLKQASLDTAMAVLQHEAMPPTPSARQLAGGGGTVWPFAAAQNLSMDSSQPGLSLNLQSASR
jgi:hypothetical protein